MFRKITALMIAAGMVLAGIGMAAAQPDIEINMYGASAQHKLWNALADDFLLDPTGGECDTAEQAEYDTKHGITRGLNCDPGGANADLEIVIRYSSRASYDGVRAVEDTPQPGPDAACADNERKMVDYSTCNFGTGVCTGLACVDVNLGASDVEWSSFTQSTSGWGKGHLNHPNDPYKWPEPGTPNMPPTSEPSGHWRPFVVPFTFFAHNSVTKYRCMWPTPYNEENVFIDGQGDLSPGVNLRPLAGDADSYNTAHKAYSKWQWQCRPLGALVDPDGVDSNGDEFFNSQDCIGYYKCVSGACAGGVRQGQACSIPAECPDVRIEQTKCRAIPIDNLTYPMFVQIFSDQVRNWNAFGPWYPNLGIVKCMRHAGSGTHATLDLGMMRDLGTLKTTSRPSGTSQIWHYTSSDDIFKCINNFAGAVGYGDADKLLKFKNIPNVHVVRVCGVEPTKLKIINGEYPFWAIQWVYYNPSDFTDPTKGLLRSRMQTWSSDPANLSEANIGISAEYWAAESEMLVTKLSDRAPITRK